MPGKFSELRDGNISVSVVIPTFNAHERLSLLLESLENQSVRNFEVIVVDDGSTDETRKIVRQTMRRFSVPLRYYYLDNTDIFGAGIARNCGGKHARGDVLLFLDQDCVAEHDLVKKHIVHHKTKDIVLGYYAGYGDEEKYYDFAKLKKCIRQRKTIPVMKDFRDRLFRSATRDDAWKCFVSAHFSIKRSLFKIFNFDEKFIQWGGQDVDLGYRLIKKGYTIYFAKDCVAYNSWKGRRFTKQKAIELSKSLIYTYKKYKTAEIKRYCLERFYHTPLIYRGALQLIFKNDHFEAYETQTTIEIDKDGRARVSLGPDCGDVAGTIGEIIPLTKFISFEIGLIDGQDKFAGAALQDVLRRLLKNLRDKNADLQMSGRKIL